MLIVLVDDNATNLAVYRRLLTHVPELEVMTFTSSADGMAFSLAREPDLIVLDQRMPAPDGLTCIGEYRRARPLSETPIIMLTGEADREIRHRALESGANDFLTKPADPVEFLARVKNLLALRGSRAELRRRNATLADEVRTATAEVVEREEETITRLMRAAEFRDNETGLHIVRMGHYAAVLGEACGLDPVTCRSLFLAAPMHDIGKVSTPDAILLKPGPLTPDEWVVMKDHARAGYRILEGSTSRVLRMAADIALGHHERWDGSGYPSGLRGDATPLHARICAVGDVFDALISRRPYKPAWPIDAAFEELSTKAGSHLDPGLVRSFVAVRPRIVAISERFSEAHVAA